MKRGRILAGAFIVFLMVFFTSAVCVLAQEESQGQDSSLAVKSQIQRLEELTQTLTAFGSRDNMAIRSILMTDLVALATKRQQILISLLEENPQAVLEAEIPAAVRTTLPAEVQPYLEQDVALEGTAQVIHVDGPILPSGGFDPGKTRYEYSIISNNRKNQIFFVGNPANKNILTDAKIRVSGLKIGDVLVANAESSAGLQVLEAPDVRDDSFGVHKVLVMLIGTYVPGPGSMSPEGAKAALELETNNFYKENSYGQTSLAIDVTPYFPITLVSKCDTYEIQTKARAAAQAAGYDIYSYRHHVFVGGMSGCPWGGLGTVGGNPSSAWITAFGQYPLNVWHSGIVTHELGHNFGLLHSHSYICGQYAATTGDVGCTSYEYGDNFDVMGAPSLHFNAYQKERLGWLNYNVSPPIDTASAAGDYTISPYEYCSGPGPLALKIFRGPTPPYHNQYFYVEYRTQYGFDKDGAIGGDMSRRHLGVIVHLVDLSYCGQWGCTGDGSFLLDMQPDDGIRGFWTIDPGQTFVDPQSGIGITTVSTSAGGATIQLSYGNPPPPAPTCHHANPSASISPASQSGTPGASINFDVTVTNNDTGTCYPSYLMLTPTITPGSYAGAVGYTLGPMDMGTSSTQTISVFLSSTIPNGIYTFSEAAKNITNLATYPYVGSASAHINVGNCTPRNPSISLSPLTQSGSAGSALTYTATVTNNDSTNCGASSFSVSTAGLPSGWIATSASLTSVLPAATGTVSLTITSPSTALPIAYSFAATAANITTTGYSGSVSGSYVIPDRILPTVSLTSPKSGAIVSGTISVTASASDNVGVAKVEFYLDSSTTPFATDTSSPYSVTLDTTSLTKGTHTLKAKASDFTGNNKTASVSVTVDNQLPTVTLTAPANGATVSGTVTITATATDNVKVARVLFYLDGTTLIATDLSSPYATSWDSKTIADGAHTVTASAFDTAGNSASSTVSVTVANGAIAPTLTFSGNPTTIIPGGSSTLTWSSTNATSCTASGALVGKQTHLRHPERFTCRHGHLQLKLCGSRRECR